ncbi:hypothetical protein ACJJTC_017310 [Scirpophaga incertulas]
MNGTEARGEEAVALALSVAVTVISAIGLLLNGYILFVIIITKQVRTPVLRVSGGPHTSLSSQIVFRSQFRLSGQLARPASAVAAGFTAGSSARKPPRPFAPTRA